MLLLRLSLTHASMCHKCTARHVRQLSCLHGEPPHVLGTYRCSNLASCTALLVCAGTSALIPPRTVMVVSRIYACAHAHTFRRKPRAPALTGWLLWDRGEAKSRRPVVDSDHWVMRCEIGASPFSFLLLKHSADARLCRASGSTGSHKLTSLPRCFAFWHSRTPAEFRYDNCRAAFTAREGQAERCSGRACHREFRGHSGESTVALDLLD